MPDAVHASQRAALWHEKAASIFVAARRQGTQVERLPVELRPSTVDDGFAIQRKVSDVLGRRIGAWKCALPPAGKVIAAPIYAELIYRSVECSFRAGFPELLADGLFNAGLVIGPRVEFPDGATPDDLRAEITIGPASAGETPVSREGRHPDGNVLSPIVWLANFLRERGLGLQAGQTVIAGSYARVLELPLGEQLHIGFGALGTLLIRFFFSNRSA
jgi:2-keto-4-pentenoate hydratase